MAVDEQRIRHSLHARLVDTIRVEMGALRSDLHAEIADLKSALLMWLVPTVIGSVGVAVTLSRVV